MKLLEKDKDIAVIEFDNGERVLAVYEQDEKLRRLSGWYIARVWNPKTAVWRDFSKPGWGATYWILTDVAKKLGLIEGE